MPAPKKIVFLGTSAFAVPSLKALAADGKFKIELVITQPDRPVGRKQLLTPPPVKLIAEELKIPVLQPEKIKTEKSAIEKIRPDFLIVISYGQILPQEILDLATIAPINVHASLLPKLRGASPLQHAILQNFSETGVTVQKMVYKLDAGPILGQSKTPVEQRETFLSLHDRLAEDGAELLIKTLSKPLTEIPQNESEVTLCGKLTREDGKIDPKTMTAETIDRMVRALTPWPGVTWNDNKLIETSVTESSEAFALPCAQGTILHVRTIQPSGKKPMSGQDYARGHSSPHS